LEINRQAAAESPEYRSEPEVGNRSAAECSAFAKPREVTALAHYLKCDVFVIGGAKTYAHFADAIDEWIVTEIPASVEDADTFMPTDFLESFELRETKNTEDDLKIKFFAKR
jgi:dihydrofolate reductase